MALVHVRSPAALQVQDVDHIAIEDEVHAGTGPGAAGHAVQGIGQDGQKEPRSRLARRKEARL